VACAAGRRYRTGQSGFQQLGGDEQWEPLRLPALAIWIKTVKTSSRLATAWRSQRRGDKVADRNLGSL
jgi:hypothetical protein